MLRLVHRAINTHLIQQTHLKRKDAASGAITVIQRFGSAANLNTHLHALVLDGVYSAVQETPVFIEAPAPTPEQLQLLLGKIIARLMRLLTRLGHLIEEDVVVYLARTDTDPDNLLAPLQAASTIWRIAQGPRAGRKVLTIVGGIDGGRREPRPARELCANEQGFSLHAG